MRAVDARWLGRGDASFGVIAKVEDPPIRRTHEQRGRSHHSMSSSVPASIARRAAARLASTGRFGGLLFVAEVGHERRVCSAGRLR